MVILGDSKYSKPAVVQALAKEPQVVLNTRLRRHRVFYRRLEPPPLAPDKQVRVATEEGPGFWVMALGHPRVA